MGIYHRCSLDDYSGIMPKIFMLLFSRVVILYFCFQGVPRSSEKLERKFFSVGPTSFLINTVSVLFVHFTFNICNLFIGEKCAIFT